MKNINLTFVGTIHSASNKSMINRPNVSGIYSALRINIRENVYQLICHEIYQILDNSKIL